MLFYFTLILVCFPFQEEYVESAVGRLSPLTLKKRSNEKFKIKSPRLLAKKDLVADPQKVLDDLRDLQQKTWLAQKSIKGKAWTNLIGRDEDLGGVFLLEFSAVTEPHKTKYLAYCKKRRMNPDPSKQKPLKPTEGMDPDKKECLMCTQAAIRTPELFATGLFLKELNPKTAVEMIEIYPPEVNRRAYAKVFDQRMFHYAGSPKQFFDEFLLARLKEKYSYQVKKRGDLIELSLNYPEVIGPAELWLFDLSKGGCCVYRYNLGYVTVEMEFAKLGEHWVPKRSIRSEDARYFETNFFDIEVNPEIDEREFEVASLPCSDKGMVWNKVTKKQTQFRYFKSLKK